MFPTHLKDKMGDTKGFWPGVAQILDWIKQQLRGRGESGANGEKTRESERRWERVRESESGSDATFMEEWKTSKLQSSETTSVALSSQPAREDFLNDQECRSAFSLLATLNPDSKIPLQLSVSLCLWKDTSGRHLPSKTPSSLNKTPCEAVRVDRWGWRS